jgi:hypothetical protein
MRAKPNKKVSNVSFQEIKENDSGGEEDDNFVVDLALN